MVRGLALCSRPLWSSRPCAPAPRAPAGPALPPPGREGEQEGGGSGRYGHSRWRVIGVNVAL